MVIENLAGLKGRTIRLSVTETCWPSLPTVE